MTASGTATPSPTPASAPTERTPGRAQVVLLLALSCLSVLGAVLIAPVQPAITDAFAGNPDVELLVPVSLTVPALMIGLIAPVAGRFVDKFGRVRLLTGALVAYSVFGTAPLYLGSLEAIVASRALVGIAEAVIMTCVTTLIADYWSGTRRNRYLGLQTVITGVSAIFFIGLGGALGESSWRAPFVLYAVGIVAAVLVPLLLWQPAPRPAGPLVPVDLRRLAAPLAVSFVGGAVFFTPIVELSFKLEDVGVTSTGVIGAISAAAAIATAVGAATFARVAARGPAVLLPAALGTAGVGIAVMGVGGSIAVVALGGVIASAGTGLLLPTLLTWAVSSLPYEQRGRGTGFWTGSLFIGQFLCPVFILAVSGLLGGLSGALVVMAVISLALAAAVLVLRPATPEALVD
ncbi:MFS transporter [Modestobacter sp. I12A-02628]|uniref:MFS transporter n=1 Tax=Goekera deserti TaxID=2497753 RepID=A0A7K3W9Z0_9ACTN|nr:MFS transporter [Goekera deserti]NDI47450.1 MFS transporter [Goekera deserti]NEL53261.1 MFS transporter [Goekera deserti]